MSISIRGLSKRFKNFTALDDVSLEIPDGELVALLGPSGSGKTTLLRIIAGLDQADAGSVWFSGQDATNTSLRERQVGFVFQHYALFRHMTIFDNIAFGLTVRPRRFRPSKEVIRARVHELLRLIQLDWIADRYPHQLSGGQRQRIALARALAVEPKVLLLDEPFGALDAKVRTELRRWLRRLHDETGITSVFVTHDQEEALEVADRVVVIDRGRIEQQGSAADIYDHPATPFVCGFIGTANRFPARVRRGIAEIGDARLPVPEHTAVEDSPAVAYVRPHHLALRKESEAGSWPAMVAHIHAVGPVARVELTADGDPAELEAHLASDALREWKLVAGDRVHVVPQRFTVFLEPRAASAVPA